MLIIIDLGGMEASEVEVQQASEGLRRILAGCLNTNSIKQSEQELMRASNHPLFVTQLCYLIPSVDCNMLSMILTTLKNYMMARYNSPENTVPAHQKDFLRNNIFRLFYQIYPNPAPTKVFKQILNIIILVDYPWPAIAQLLDEDLQGSIVASVYFIRQVAKANEYTTGEERNRFEQFVLAYFPRLESIVEKIFQNYNEQTAELLYEALKAFYSAFHIEIPYYLRNFAALDKWILFAQTILNVQSDPLSLKNQELAARIYLKLFSLYANDSLEGKVKEHKGWAAQFRARYCERVFQHVVNLIGERKGNEDLQSTLVNCLYEVVKQSTLRPLFTKQHCEVLLYSHCLPLCQSNQQELALFRNDPSQYVHRGEDLTCETLRRAILDLIENVAATLSFDNKSEMMRMVEYSAGVLQNSTSDTDKEVVIRLLSKIGRLVLKNKYLKQQFQNLTVGYFIPLLGNPNPLLVSLTLELLSLYLPFGELDNETVNRLMELVYGRITEGDFLVMRYNAILAFTALLHHRAALEAAAPHFNTILKIYVEMLNSFQHENLLSCLESIVKHFSKEVVVFAPQLISHLVRMFASLCKSTQQPDEDDEPDSNSPATAALSTITQLLDCKLDPEVYHTVSGEIIELLRGIFNDYPPYFDAILSLFNVLLHHASTIADFNYPYVACRKLLEGDNSILALSQLPHEIALEISNSEVADSEFGEDLVSILKNLIQKMPDNLLRRYPFPTHPQLILCLIENKRLSPEEIFRLDTSQVGEVWLPYITGYTKLIYGVGELAPAAVLRPLKGVSLFPWLQGNPQPELVRLIVIACEAEEEQDEELYEENTAQLLQKYANEEEDEEDFEEGSDINYTYHYDSPFDFTKDKDALVQALKNMSQEEALKFSNRLSNRYRKKLETLFN